uniref:Uncharacterized protein n=1 Tax=Anopheles christyi TaxID=43041 RepID=A0A182KIA7_9DIPT
MIGGKTQGAGKHSGSELTAHSPFQQRKFEGPCVLYPWSHWKLIIFPFSIISIGVREAVVGRTASIVVRSTEAS